MSTLEQKLKELADKPHAIRLELSTQDTFASWTHERKSEQTLFLTDYGHNIKFDQEPYRKRHYTLGVPVSLQESLAQGQSAFGDTVKQAKYFTNHLAEEWNELRAHEQEQLLSDLLENYSAFKLVAATARDTVNQARDLPATQTKHELDRFYGSLAHQATQAALEVDDKMHTPHLLESTAKKRYEHVNQLLTPAIAHLQG